jgi:hypothetical protein
VGGGGGGGSKRKVEGLQNSINITRTCLKALLNEFELGSHLASDDEQEDGEDGEDEEGDGDEHGGERRKERGRKKGGGVGDEGGQRPETFDVTGHVEGRNTDDMVASFHDFCAGVCIRDEYNALKGMVTAYEGKSKAPPPMVMSSSVPAAAAREERAKAASGGGVGGGGGGGGGGTGSQAGRAAGGPPKARMSVGGGGGLAEGGGALAGARLQSDAFRAKLLEARNKAGK